MVKYNAREISQSGAYIGICLGGGLNFVLSRKEGVGRAPIYPPLCTPLITQNMGIERRFTVVFFLLDVFLMNIA